MFEIEGRIYELRYDIKTVEQIENTLGVSIINLVRNIPSLYGLKTLMGMALYNEHGNKVSSKRGIEVAESLIQQKGLVECFNECIEKIDEDCAFLFRNA